jgi:uncharacterized protein (TIGR00730 family)
MGGGADGTPGGTPPAPADRDLAWLERAELRPVRLVLEYLKPELALQERGIRHTIVVFGSTRLVEPELAARAVAEAERAAAKAPYGSGAQQALESARRAQELSRYYAIGRELGGLVARHDGSEAGGRLVVMTGGGPGGMEAANRGAREAGAPSIGLNIALPVEQPLNPYLTPDLTFHFRYFALRKLHFLLRARALVALPGGFGTFDELFETLCLIQTGKHPGMPVVLVGESFWRRAVDFEFLVASGVISRADLDLFAFAEDAPQTWRTILDWYAARGREIFDVSGAEPTAEL